MWYLSTFIVDFCGSRCNRLMAKTRLLRESESTQVTEGVGTRAATVVGPGIHLQEYKTLKNITVNQCRNTKYAPESDIQ